MFTVGSTALSYTGIGAIGGATLTGIVGGVRIVAELGTTAFATAEYQEVIMGDNWMLDAGMGDSLYNSLMIAFATIATLGTLASSIGYAFKIKSIDKIGKLYPSNHPDEGFYGIKFKNARNSLRSLEIQNHPPHGFHFQLNS